jgi:hypothetical protein
MPIWGATAIERRASGCLGGCLRKLGLKDVSIPVPVDDWIERALDIRFGVADLSYLGDYVLGAAFVDTREILVSEKVVEQEGRYRFTCAHELGHFILHAKIRKRFQDTMLAEPFQSRRVEREADRFAAAFLMPIRQIERELFGICKRRELEPITCIKMLIKPTHEAHWLWRKVFLPEFTKRFEVSVSAAIIRMRDLRLRLRGEVPFMPEILQRLLLKPAAPEDGLDKFHLVEGRPVREATLFQRKQ